jgi:hypothetical protein
MSRYQLQLKERRTSERKRLTGLMPGRFQINGKEVSARPVDISEHGIGVIIAHEYPVGTVATLCIGDRQVSLEFLWGEPDFGKHDMWRYGLVCRDETLDLSDEFTLAGCLK